MPAPAAGSAGASALEARVSALEVELAALRERFDAMAGGAASD